MLCVQWRSHVTLTGNFSSWLLTCFGHWGWWGLTGEEPQQSLGIHSSMEVVLDIRVFYLSPLSRSRSLSLSPSPPSINRAVPFPWGSQYLAAFTLNIVPLRWIPINSFSSTAVRNSILQALNHWPSEKVGELQILRSPLLYSGSYWSMGALIFCWQISLSLSFSLSCCLRVRSNMFFPLPFSFLVLLSSSTSRL